MGRSTVESIQSGVFYGAIGACKEIIHRMKQEVFAHQEVLILGTGGFATLFDKQGIFTYHLPDLVLLGLRQAAIMNSCPKNSELGIF